jgi:hypothetical protein
MCPAKSHSVVINMFYLIVVNSMRARVQSPVSVIFIFKILTKASPSVWYGKISVSGQPVWNGYNKISADVGWLEWFRRLSSQHQSMYPHYDVT